MAEGAEEVEEKEQNRGSQLHFVMNSLDNIFCSFFFSTLVYYAAGYRLRWNKNGEEKDWQNFFFFWVMVIVGKCRLYKMRNMLNEQQIVRLREP